MENKTCIRTLRLVKAVRWADGLEVGNNRNTDQVVITRTEPVCLPCNEVHTGPAPRVPIFPNTFIRSVSGHKVTTTGVARITMGSVCSAIGNGTNAIIAAIANLLMAIVGAFTVMWWSTAEDGKKATIPTTAPLLWICVLTRGYLFLTPISLRREDTVCCQ
ncbi:hypothetical protein EDD16DRAFT_960642 [Pisolithus croceorrhizus]|nr:hypothetical protein EDD16DRAFT_960642 [Pisolithus croceorrhizus]